MPSPYALLHLYRLYHHSFFACEDCCHHWMMEQRWNWHRVSCSRRWYSLWGKELRSVFRVLKTLCGCSLQWGALVERLLGNASLSPLYPCSHRDWLLGVTSSCRDLVQWATGDCWWWWQHHRAETFGDALELICYNNDDEDNPDFCPSINDDCFSSQQIHLWDSWLLERVLCYELSSKLARSQATKMSSAAICKTIGIQLPTTLRYKYEI